MGQAPSSTAPACPSATAAPHHIFAFGDSYTGANFNANGPQPNACNPMGNPDPYGLYVFNGTNWFSTLMEIAPYNTLGYDLGIGGAVVDPVLLNSTASSLVTQAQTFASTYANATFWSASDSLFMFWFGINDIIQSYQNYNAVDGSDLNTYFNTVENIYNAGARRFFFMGAPRKFFALLNTSC